MHRNNPILIKLLHKLMYLHTQTLKIRPKVKNLQWASKQDNIEVIFNKYQLKKIYRYAKFYCRFSFFIFFILFQNKYYLIFTVFVYVIVNNSFFNF